MDEPFPGMPEPPPGRVGRSSGSGVRASRIRSGRLCERCCLDIHVLGMGWAPYPRVARWRVVDGDVVQRLCEGHKAEVCDVDAG